MLAEASRDVLVDYIKKQRIKIKKLEKDLEDSGQTADDVIRDLRKQLEICNTPGKNEQTKQAAGAGTSTGAEDEDVLTSGWNSFAGFVSNVVSEVGLGEGGESEAGNVSTSGVSVSVEQLRNLVAEKDSEIDSLKIQISEVESSTAEALNAKSVEVDCHMEVIEALKSELAKAQAQMRAAEKIAATTVSAAQQVPPAAPAETLSAEKTYSQEEVDAAVEAAVAGAVQSAVQGSSADLAVLQGKVQDLQVDCENGRVKLAKFNTVIKAKMKEVETLNEQITAADERRAQDEVSSLTMTADFETLRSDYAALQIQFNTLRIENDSTINTLKADAEKATAAQLRALDKLKDLKRQLSEKGGENSTLQASLSVEQKRVYMLQQQADNAASELELLRSNAKSSDKLKKVQAALASKDVEIAAFMSDVSTKDATISKKERELIDLTKSIETTVNEATVALQEQLDAAREEEILIRDEMIKREEELASTQEVLATREAKLEEALATIEENSKELDEYISEQQQLAGALRDMEEAASQQKTVISKLEQQLLDKEAAVAASNESDGVIESLRATLTANDAVIATLTADLSEKEASIAEKERELREVKLSMQLKLTAKESAMSALMSDNDTNVADYERELVELQASMRSATAAKANELSVLSSEKDAHMADFTASMQTVLSEKDAEIAALTSDKDAKARELDKYGDLSSSVQLSLTMKEEVIAALTADIISKDAGLAEKECELAELKTSMQAAFETKNAEINSLASGVSNKDAQIAEKERELDVLAVSLQEVSAAKETEVALLKKEVGDLTVAHSTLKTTAKKHIHVWKTRFEELTTEHDQLLEAKNSESASSAEEIQALQKQLKELAVQHELKDLNRTEDIESAEKVHNLQISISEMESEMASLQEIHGQALAALQMKLNMSEEEAALAREEREHQRRRVLDLEGQIEIDALDHVAQIKEVSQTAEDRLQAIQQELNAAKHSIELQTVKIQDVEMLLGAAKAEKEALEANLSDELSVLKSKLLVLQTSSSSMTKELGILQSAVDDGNTQNDVLRDKVQRLKALLQRSKTVTQEKVAEISKLKKQGGVHDRAARFEVLALVDLPNQPSKSQECKVETVSSQRWCLLYIDKPLESASNSVSVSDEAESQQNSSLGLRWVEESTAHAWEAEGSVVLGETPWPESLQTTHRRQLKGAKVTFERELENTKESLREQEEAFAAYKARAQAALKRLGTEQAAAAAKGTAEEEQQKENLEKELLDVRLENTALLAQLSAAKEAFEEAQSQVELQKAAVIAEHEQMLSSAISTAVDTALNAQRESHATTVEEQKNDMLVEQEQLRNQLRTCQESIRELEAAASSTAALAVAVAVSGISSSGSPEKASSSTWKDVTTPSGETRSSSADNAGTDDDSNSLSPAALSTSSNSGSRVKSNHSPGQTPTSMGQGKALLYQRAEQELLEQIAELRKENSSVTSLYRQANEQRALCEEQLSVVKDSLRDVEATLAREKEFFAQSGGERALNVEYLANILKKFLLTDPSNATGMTERARMASVLCQILHFQPKDIAAVEALWKEKSTRGPLGLGIANWLGGN